MIEFCGKIMCERCFRTLASQEECCDCQYSENGENSLTIGTVLNGRFIIGGESSTTNTAIDYRAYDTSEQRVVYIEELFPRLEAIRKDCMVIFSHDDFSQIISNQYIFFNRMFAANSGFAVPSEAFYQNGTVYMVYDSWYGNTLRESVELSGGLPNEDAVRLLHSLINCLNVIRQTTKCHASIVPDNIFVNGNDYLLGSCRIYESDIAEYTHDAVCFDRDSRFMEAYDFYHYSGSTSFDRFSVGAVMYYAICGVYPGDASCIDERFDLPLLEKKCKNRTLLKIVCKLCNINDSYTTDSDLYSDAKRLFRKNGLLPVGKLKKRNLSKHKLCDKPEREEKDDHD